MISSASPQIRICGRNTSGVKVMNLEGRQKIVSIAIVPHEEPGEELPEGEEAPEEEAPAAQEEFRDTSLE